MSRVNIILQSPDSDAQQYDWLNVGTDTDSNDVQKIINHFRGGLAGMRSISGHLDLLAPIASGNIVITNASISSNDTVSIGQQAMTAVTANPSTNQFLKGSAASDTANNLVAAILASPIASIIVLASASGGTVSISSMHPGYIGNEIKLATSNTAGFALTQLSGGSGVVSTFNLQ